MSKITLDNLSDNLKAYLEGLGLSEEQVLNLINENGLNEEELKAMLKDTMSINELSTNSKTVIGAINELFQSANNGKQLIANAIGEPVSKDDTFSAMSSDINGLLSQFKTNMMNNGITVESTDRFKSLIDKIASLADNEGRGIQYVTGNATANNDISYDFLSSDGTENGAIYIDLSNLGFTPMFIIVTYNNSPTSMSVYIDKSFGFYFSNLMNVKGKSFTIRSYSDGSSGIMWHSDNNNLKIAATTTGVHTYHAIGVGEEDTTLRDSLASILEEEGVSVTEEDDMASLISKVDNEFDRKNANSAKLDIIFASELPTTVKEGQVVIISNTEGNVYINKIDPGNLINGDVFIEVNHLESVVDIPIQTEGLDVGIPVYRANQFNDGVGSQVMCYVGKNGEWIETVPNDIYLYSPEQGLHPKLGEFVLDSSTVSFGAEYLTFVAKASSGTMTTRTATSKNKIDVTRFTKLEVIAGGDTYGANSGQALKVTIGNKSAFMVDQNGKYTKTVDITDLTGEYNLVLSCNAAYSDYTCLIYSIRLYV